jgi:hypothetical protein
MMSCGGLEFEVGENFLSLHRKVLKGGFSMSLFYLFFPFFFTFFFFSPLMTFF